MKAFVPHNSFRQMLPGITLSLAFAIAGQAYAAESGAPQKYTPTDLVDGLNGVFGKQAPASRAVHAKGIVLDGTFTPSSNARSLSKAALLTGKTIPVTIRFSDFAGVMNIPDNDPHANPRGFAIKFRLPDGSESDVVTHSFNGFPSPTADDFRELLAALAASGAAAPKPTPLETYFETHPVAKTFLTTQKPAPQSYATVPFYGVNAFKFTNAKGQSHFVRYQFIPLAGEHYLTPEEIAKQTPNYLADELAVRLKKAPVQFKWLAQIAEDGDKIEDPSIAWPASRKLVELGVISLKQITPDNPVVAQALMFIPANVPAGIEPADPMITTRAAAYPVSYGRRHQQ